MTASIPQSPVINAGLLYVNGLSISLTGPQEITMQLGAARDSTNTNDIILGATSSTPDVPTTPGIPIIINGANVGANGVDVAPMIPFTMYAVYEIGDSTDYQSTAGLFSLNTIQPNLPGGFPHGGYDMYRRIGWVLTDDDANILQFFQYGADQQRMYYYDAAIPTLTDGTATTFTPIDLSVAVPPIPTEVLFLVSYVPSVNTNIAAFLPFGFTSSNVSFQYSLGNTGMQVSMMTIPCALNNSGLPEILYKVDSGDLLSLQVVGFKDYLS
jgi:hypothetical protein